MRRHRPVYYPLAFLTVALGVAAAPGIARADDGTDPVVPADDTTHAPPPAPDQPAPTPPTAQPPASTTPDEPDLPAPPDVTHTVPVPHPTPPTATTVPDSQPTPPTATTVPESQPTPTATTVPESQPAPPPTTVPAAPLVERPTEPTVHDDDELDTDVSDALPDVRVVRPIAFPVLGAVSYGNDWGNCRAGCARRHQGTDLIGVRMQPLLAAVDGTVTRIRHENVGTAGSVITITGTDGWYYNYFHVNNDTPGTDDGLAGPEWQISPQLTVGSTVRAGQVIGYMGDSGNAEGSVPHLHFEIRQPDRTPVNPYPSLAAAQQAETCQPLDAVTLTDPAELSPAAVAVRPIGGGGHWLIDSDGRLFAEGTAAPATPAGDGCPTTPASVVTPASVEEPDALIPAAVPAPSATAAPALSVPVAPFTPVEPAPASDTPAPAASMAASWMTWRVERGQSLWEIAQEAYGVSETGATASLVNLVFENNRDVVSNPSVIQIGWTLVLPPLV